ncbi:hypothetical protein ES288_D02G157200v1 [Gossypium darwinii]|uniref:Uncharacterized protein n=1 Tax=Gossypium darwinii TaxID=34276 RepID=A0A5D2DEZ1_GOSDA|nr:hypothetical protein ES288_D02G157200v1 [Gossypium darwinii]
MGIGKPRSRDGKKVRPGGEEARTRGGVARAGGGHDCCGAGCCRNPRVSCFLSFGLIGLFR